MENPESLKYRRTQPELAGVPSSGRSRDNRTQPACVAATKHASQLVVQWRRPQVVADNDNPDARQLQRVPACVTRLVPAELVHSFRTPHHHQQERHHSRLQVRCRLSASDRPVDSGCFIVMSTNAPVATNSMVVWPIPVYKRRIVQ